MNEPSGRNAPPPLTLLQGGMPVGWDTQIADGPDGRPGVLVRIEHACGSTCVLLPASAAEQMAAQITAAAAEARKPRIQVAGRLPHNGARHGT